MLIDFREVDNGVTIETDVCIVGAGAAGITIARLLAATGSDICLLESGDLVPDRATQKLCAGDVIGLPADMLCAEQFRCFGGTTHKWSGYCQPLDRLDFEARDWVDNSGWPITLTDLLPWYRRAQTVCELGPFRYQSATWEEHGLALPSLRSESLEYRFWQLSPPTRFGEVYRENLARLSNVRVFLNATVIGIELREDRSGISFVTAAAMGGNRARIHATHFVIACGSIETARLLLESGVAGTRAEDHGGGAVGRFFMTHAQITVGTVFPTHGLEGYRALFDSLPLYRPAFRHSGNGDLVIGFGVAAPFQRANKTLNCSLRLVPIPVPSYNALREVYGDVFAGRRPRELVKRLGSALLDLDGFLEAMYQRVANGQPRVSAFAILATVEDAPNPQSHVSLTSKRDTLGMRRVLVDWRLTPQCKDTLRQATKLLSDAAPRLGLGQVQTEKWLNDDDAWPAALQGGLGHHVGTARMSDSPATGVVDRNCRVHAMSNLFVAGGAVFATSGSANPMLTIVALALRLADHIEKRLKRSRNVSRER
ncbi:MAG: GMC family oxidoreductase [Gammaproteobacteria bacterium]|nr:GMC family oxidoreductase [Gammaproteobacteria bacterium]